jgi:hypothetical protein
MTIKDFKNLPINTPLIWASETLFTVPIQIGEVVFYTGIWSEPSALISIRTRSGLTFGGLYARRFEIASKLGKLLYGD